MKIFAIPIACLLALASACEDSGDDDADDGTGADAGVDAGAAGRCEELLEAPASNRATVDVFDPYSGEEPATFEMYIDDCHALGEETFPRGGAFGQGFLPGERTLRLLLDDEEVSPPEPLSTAHGDAFWYALDDQVPPQLHGTSGSILDPPEGRWRIHLLSMSDEDITIHRAIEPDAEAPEYEVLTELGPGESFSADIAVGPENGAPVRIERDGEVIFDDNLGFVLSCDPGEWVGGIVMFTLIDDTYARYYIVYPDDPCRDF
jgi:hypothetical protein